MNRIHEIYLLDHDVTEEAANDLAMEILNHEDLYSPENAFLVVAALVKIGS